MMRIICLLLLSSAAVFAQAVHLERGERNHLLVPVQVNGHAATFLLDTGVEISFLQQDRAAAFGVTQSGNNLFAGGRYYPAGAINELRVGSHSLGSVQLGLFNPAQFRGPVPGKGKKAADGILGLDLLRKFGAVVNCRTQELFFHSANGPAVDLAATTRALGFTRIPIQPTGRGLLSVPVTIGNQGGALVIDTGAFITVFNEAAVRSLQVQAAPSKLKARTAGGRLSNLELARIENFRIGGVPIEPQHFATMKLFGDRKDLRTYTPGIVNQIQVYDEKSMRARLEIWGLLGAELLYLHSAIIDLENMMLYLK